MKHVKLFESLPSECITSIADVNDVSIVTWSVISDSTPSLDGGSTGRQPANRSQRLRTFDEIELFVICV